MTQRQIEMAHRRSLKTKYKHLTSVQKRYVKLVERERMLEHSFHEAWRYVTTRQAPPYLPENTPEELLDAIDRAEAYRLELVKVRASMDRLVEKYDLDTDYILNMHMQSNLAPGGSF